MTVATAYPTIRLESPGLDPLDLRRSDGWVGQRLDPGDPVTRDDAEDAPGADGTIDLTEWAGASNVTLGLHLDPSRWPGTRRQMLDRLRAFTAPGRTVTMFVREAADDPELQATLRRGQWSSTLTLTEAADVVVQWVNPYGIWESAELHTASTAASGGVSGDGLVAPVVAPIVLPSATVAGAVEVVNAGTARAYPVIRLYGPSTDGGELTNLETGRALVFDDTLDIAAGDFVEIDMRTHRILYNADPDESRRDRLVFPASRWWVLEPAGGVPGGAQRIRWQPGAFSPPASAVIEWRDAYL